MLLVVKRGGIPADVEPVSCEAEVLFIKLRVQGLVKVVIYRPVVRGLYPKLDHELYTGSVQIVNGYERVKHASIGSDYGIYLFYEFVGVGAVSHRNLEVDASGFLFGVVIDVRLR